MSDGCYCCCGGDDDDDAVGCYDCESGVYLQRQSCSWHLDALIWVVQLLLAYQLMRATSKTKTTSVGHLFDRTVEANSIARTKKPRQSVA